MCDMVVIHVQKFTSVYRHCGTFLIGCLGCQEQYNAKAHLIQIAGPYLAVWDPNSLENNGIPFNSFSIRHLPPFTRTSISALFFPAYRVDSIVLM